MTKLAMVEIFDAFNPIFSLFGLNNPPFWMKAASVLALLLTPSFCIVGCIFWCESRQLKNLEKITNENRQKEEDQSEESKAKETSSKEKPAEKSSKAKKID